MLARRDFIDSKLALTPSVEEGPYYKAGSPERSNFVRPTTHGNRLILEGRVLDRDGIPLAHAWLDFWHADSTGKYDNRGFHLRGHQYSDENGNYRLETIRPRDYLSRAAHIHAKVRAEGSRHILTTQLFFPDEPKNTTDPIFEFGTVMNVADMQDAQHATFDFVIDKD